MLLAGIGVVCAGAAALQTLHVPLQDSHFDLGFAQGRHFRPAMAAYLNSSNDLQRVLLPFCAAAGNATKCASLRRSAERAAFSAFAEPFVEDSFVFDFESGAVLI